MPMITSHLVKDDMLNIVERLRRELAIAQALLEIQSELGRLPNSQWRDSVNAVIKKWFNNPIRPI